MLTKAGRLQNVSEDPIQNSRHLFDISNDPYLQMHQQVLDLRFVPLQDLPIEKLSSLEAIYLHENQLTHLPELHHFPRLHTLSLGRNHIREIPRSITKIWMSLRRLILGANYIHSLPFVEEEMMLAHGSIGSNLIPEPIGYFWMLRQDAQKSISALHVLSRPKPGTPRPFVDMLKDLFLHNCLLINEPMIFEHLFSGYIWNEEKGLFHPNNEHRTEKEALETLLPMLSPEIMLHKSISIHLSHRF